MLTVLTDEPPSFKATCTLNIYCLPFHFTSVVKARNIKPIHEYNDTINIDLIDVDVCCNECYSIESINTSKRRLDHGTQRHQLPVAPQTPQVGTTRSH